MLRTHRMKKKRRNRLSKKEVEVLDNSLDNIVMNLPIEIADVILQNKKNIQKACEVAKEGFSDIPEDIEYEEYIGFLRIQRHIIEAGNRRESSIK